MPIATPPPVPERFIKSNHSNMSYGTRLALISLIGVLLMITSFIVWGFTSSREATSTTTAREIAEAWGETVKIDGVELERDSLSSAIVPESYRCSAVVESQILHRSIYEAQVYNAQISLSGKMQAIADSCGASRFVFGVSPASVVSIDPLVLGGREYAWTQTENGFVAEVNEGGDEPFQINLKVKGSQGIIVKQCGLKNEINISGNCANPSFGTVDESLYEKPDYYGADPCPLPEKRSVTKEQFSASWCDDNAMSIATYASVTFLLGVDRYQKVERSLKYAFLIILFTFLSVFFAERLTKYPIPVLNYLLIGLALILFYVLLLSLCEHMTFGVAYAIASAMTACLISLYMWGMLHSKKVAGTILAILAVMYASCYVLLCLSTYALIMGALMMFCALAVSMYASLKIKF